jgi:hypothetical protein
MNYTKSSSKICHKFGQSTNLSYHSHLKEHGYDGNLVIAIRKRSNRSKLSITIFELSLMPFEKVTTQHDSMKIGMCDQKRTYYVYFFETRLTANDVVTVFP